jgi:uncharacterized ferredoxin-like protein
VELAEEMAAIAQRLRQLADGQRAGLLEREAGVERRIDEAVYELYGLSDSEVEAVERGLGEMIK